MHRRVDTTARHIGVEHHQDLRIALGPLPGGDQALDYGAYLRGGDPRDVGAGLKALGVEQRGPQGAPGLWGGRA